MTEKNFEQVKEILSRNLKRLRSEQKIAQEALALKAGIDRTVLSKIERKVTNPSLMALTKLAITLKIEVAELLTEQEN